MCNYKSSLYSERTLESNSLGINKAIVNASLAIGKMFYSNKIYIYDITLCMLCGVKELTHVMGAIS